jgi:hypothetical protein
VIRGLSPFTVILPVPERHLRADHKQQATQGAASAHQLIRSQNNGVCADGPAAHQELSPIRLAHDLAETSTVCYLAATFTAGGCQVPSMIDGAVSCGQ